MEEYFEINRVAKLGRRLQDGDPQVDPDVLYDSLSDELDYGNFKATLPSSNRLRHRLLFILIVG